MHGWPGSIIEFIEIIDQLAHPENYGGNKEDGMTVIAPSLPGFGFQRHLVNHLAQERLLKF